MGVSVICVIYEKTALTGQFVIQAYRILENYMKQNNIEGVGGMGI